jgi:transposase
LRWEHGHAPCCEEASMAPKSKVELYAAIRRDCRAGLSKRAVMRKYGVGHPTVQNALESAWPRPRKKLPPRPTRLDPYKPVIDEMLRADLDAPRKQRHTAKRVFDRLLEEHQAHGVSYGMVRDYVAVRRGEIRAMAGCGPVEAFVPQSHRPGVEAEVDFGDVTVRLAGQTVTCYLFSFRLSYSGKAVHRIFASGGQEAFFEGHVHALSVLGGYVGDNSSAISRCRSGWSLPSRSSDGLAAAVGTTRRCRGESRGIAWARLGRRLPGVRGGPLSAEHAAGHRLRPEGLLLGGAQGTGRRRHRGHLRVHHRAEEAAARAKGRPA